MTSLSAMLTKGEHYKHLKCAAKGCTRSRPGLAPLCTAHQQRKARYGHPDGNALMKAEYKDELKEVKAFCEAHSDHPALIAAHRFITDWLTQASKKEAPAGNLIFGWLYRHQVPAPDILAEILAVWLYSDRHPQLLPDDQRLTYALARNAMKLGGMPRTSYGKHDCLRHPPATELSATGERIRQLFPRLFINMSAALKAKADEAVALKNDLQTPFN